MKTLIAFAALAFVLATGTAAVLTAASTPAAACSNPNCWKSISAKRTAHPPVSPHRRASQG
jgi:hypothetical protein